MMHKKITTVTHLGLIAVMLTLFMVPFAQVTKAGSISGASDVMTVQTISTESNHSITFVTPTGIAASGTIIITFPSDFSVHASLTYTDIDVSDDAVQVTLAAANSGATWGAVRTSATVITLTNGTTVVAPYSSVNIKIGSNASSQTTGVYKVTNPSTSGSKNIAISGTFGDTGDIAVPIINDYDVVVNGQVPQSLTFSINASALSLTTLTGAAGTLSSTAVAYGSHTMTMATNAPSGMSVAVTGNTLTSSAGTITAMPAATTSSVGTEQFGLNLSSTANVTPVVGGIATGSSGSVTRTNYGTQDSFRFVSGDTIATTAGGLDSTVFYVSYIANIAGSTEAGSYTTTLTYTATGTF